MHSKILLFGCLMLFFQLSYADKDQSLRDPTQPLKFEKKKSTVSLTLQAIFTKNGSKRAVINGVILEQGDSYRAYKIIKISSSSVQYEFSGVKGELKLRPNLIKVKKSNS